MKRPLTVLTLGAVFVLLTAPAAQAVPAEKVTGSITMSDPMQAATFSAFEDPMKGSITYTNFEFAVDGTGVWVPMDAFDVGFGVHPDPAIVATYTFTVGSVTPLSPTSLEFSGTGDGPDPWYGPFEGTISGSTFSFTLLETNGVETYTLLATGAIDASGAVAGTWTDDYGTGRTGTFEIADVGYEAFSFTAPVTCVEVDPDNGEALFGYTIPDGLPLEGLGVAVRVTDGGSPGAEYDTYKHNFSTGVGSCSPAGGVYSTYPIESGNLTVHG